MPSQMIIRIDTELKDQVNKLARIEGKSVSEVVREMLSEYVKTRDIGSYIDNLWDRINGKLESKGFARKDIENVIRDVSANK